MHAQEHHSNEDTSLFSSALNFLALVLVAVGIVGVTVATAGSAVGVVVVVAVALVLVTTTTAAPPCTHRNTTATKIHPSSAVL
jgi:fatty acid desaturase